MIDWLVYFVVTGAAATAVAALVGVPIGAARSRRRTREWAEQCARVKERSKLSSDAQRQNAWFLVGDPRGIYGDFPPTS